MAWEYIGSYFKSQVVMTVFIVIVEAFIQDNG